MESARRVLASSRRVVMQFFGNLGRGSVSGVGRLCAGSRAFSTRRRGCSMSRYARCSIRHDLIASDSRGPVHIMQLPSAYCVMPSVLESHQATQFTAADPGPSVTISAAEGLQIQRNRGQSEVVLFSDGLPQAYN